MQSYSKHRKKVVSTEKLYLS